MATPKRVIRQMLRKKNDLTRQREALERQISNVDGQLLNFALDSAQAVAASAAKGKSRKVQTVSGLGPVKREKKLLEVLDEVMEPGKEYEVGELEGLVLQSGYLTQNDRYFQSAIGAELRKADWAFKPRRGFWARKEEQQEQPEEAPKKSSAKSKRARKPAASKKTKSKTSKKSA